MAGPSSASCLDEFVLQQLDQSLLRDATARRSRHHRMCCTRRRASTIGHRLPDGAESAM